MLLFYKFWIDRVNSRLNNTLTYVGAFYAVAKVNYKTDQ